MIVVQDEDGDFTDVYVGYVFSISQASEYFEKAFRNMETKQGKPYKVIRLTAGNCLPVRDLKLFPMISYFLYPGGIDHFWFDEFKMKQYFVSFLELAKYLVMDEAIGSTNKYLTKVPLNTTHPTTNFPVCHFWPYLGSWSETQRLLYAINYLEKIEVVLREPMLYKMEVAQSIALHWVHGLVDEDLEELSVLLGCPSRRKYSIGLLIKIMLNCIVVKLDGSDYSKFYQFVGVLIWNKLFYPIHDMLPELNLKLEECPCGELKNKMGIADFEV